MWTVLRTPPTHPGRRWSHHRLLLLLGLGPLLYMCRPLPVPQELARIPSPCPAPSVDITGWQRFDGRTFSFRLPPEYRRVPVQAIDAYVEVWHSQAGEISFNSGMYSAPLEPYAEPEIQQGYTVCQVKISGKNARVVSYWSPQAQMYMVAARWVVDPGAPGASLAEIRVPEFLTIHVGSRSPAEAEKLRAVLWSVHFKNDAGA